MKIIIFLSFFSIIASSNSDTESARLYQESRELTPAKKVLIKMRSFEFNTTSKSGISENVTNGNDQRSLSVAYNMSSDFKDLGSVSGFEVGYQFKSSSYTNVWYSLFFKSLSANFDAISQEVQASQSPASTDANSNQLRDKNKQEITQIGLGMGYRFSFFANSFNLNRLSEMITAHLTVASAIDSTDSENYKGYGLTSDYLIDYRLSQSLYMGAKLSYSILSMERKALSEEKIQERSLVYGWLALGVQFGFYF